MNKITAQFQKRLTGLTKQRDVLANSLSDVEYAIKCERLMLKQEMQDLRWGGMTYQQIANGLNKKKITGGRGAKWSPSSVRKYLN